MAEASKGSSSRTYKVLREVGDQGPQHERPLYDDVCDIVASSPSQAIRLVVTEEGGGAYVAVPKGNWTRERYVVEPQPPKITRVDDEPTAAVDQPQDLEQIIDAAEQDEQGSLTDAEFEQRKAEIAARRHG